MRRERLEKVVIRRTCPDAYDHSCKFSQLFSGGILKGANFCPFRTIADILLQKYWNYMSLVPREA